MVKAYEKIVGAKLRAFLTCKKHGLMEGSIRSAAAFQDCFDETTVGMSAKVDRATFDLSRTLAKKCAGVDLAVAFPGVCSGALDFASCVDDRVECRVCLMLNAMDGLNADCDAFDDGAANGSCLE